LQHRKVDATPEAQIVDTDLSRCLLAQRYPKMRTPANTPFRDLFKPNKQ
jgi:hypothetical protein